MSESTQKGLLRSKGVPVSCKKVKYTMKNHNNPQPVSLKQLGMEMSKTKIY